VIARVGLDTADPGSEPNEHKERDNGAADADRHDIEVVPRMV
jgi:hypothetical protein